jgi:MoaA/NifB/PqqE/SkfB family radical SAM enzyme
MFQEFCCGAVKALSQLPDLSAGYQWKLWIYTNYDCNLRCSYCVAESSPSAPRREIGLDNACRLVDEAADLGFQSIYFTGGEPFLLDDIFAMLAYSSARLPTAVLTNAMLLRGTRLEKLCSIANENLIIQVSLDGSEPAHHDPYRGHGSWKRTVEGIQLLQQRGFRVRLSTTETPANTEHLAQICQFFQQLGIPEEDHFIRPLAKRGFSHDGMEVNKTNLVPEITVNAQGVYWHPLATDADLLITEQVFPLSAAVRCMQEQWQAVTSGSETGQKTFT